MKYGTVQVPIKYLYRATAERALSFIFGLN